MQPRKYTVADDAPLSDKDTAKFDAAVAQADLDVPATAWSLKEAAEHLGVTSHETVQNWLCGGHFPGAKQMEGHWRFLIRDVKRVKEQMDKTKALNASGALEVPDLGDLDGLCGSCGGKSVVWFENQNFFVGEDAPIEVPALAGWECKDCGEVVFNPDSARKYANAGDAWLSKQRA